MKNTIKYAVLILALSANAAMYSQNNTFADNMPKKRQPIVTIPDPRQSQNQRSITDQIDAYYEDGGIYITLWGEGELVEVEVCNTTNGNYLVVPAEGFCSVVDINDMGCGEYTLLIYCNNDILYVGNFTL